MENRYFISYFAQTCGYINEIKCEIVNSNMDMEEFIIEVVKGGNIVINCIRLN